MNPRYVFLLALAMLSLSTNASGQEPLPGFPPEGSDEPTAPHDHGRAMVGAALGGAVGLVVTYALSGGVATYLLESSLRGAGSLADDEGDLTLRAALSLTATLPVMPLVSAFAIWQGGRMAGGNANYGLTLLGTLGGGALGGGLAALLFRDDWRAFSYFGGAISAALQYAGGLLTYHVSDRARARHNDPPRLLLEPHITPSRFGLSLGVGGHF